MSKTPPRPDVAAVAPLSAAAEQPTEPRFDETLESDGRTRTLRVDLDCPAPVRAVWSALTDERELESWFPLEAGVEPGPGGAIRLAWDECMDDLCPILAWEPDRHLRIGWPVTDPEGERRQLVVDFHVEGRGGATRLRMVHSGFAADASWDEIVGEHRKGWAFELRSLQHYLTHHRGRRRGLVRAEAAVAGSDRDAWTRLFAEDGWLADGTLAGAAAGERYWALTSSGERLEGRAMLREPWTDLAARVENLAHSILRVHIGRWGPPEEPRKVRLWLYCWQLPEERRAEIERSWLGELDRLFPA